MAINKLRREHLNLQLRTAEMKDTHGLRFNGIIKAEVGA
jgi:hypothetical protein